MLSLGEESDDGIAFSNYAEGEPLITGATLHANSDIAFDASPGIDASTVTLTAGGNISGYGGGMAGVEPVSLKSISAILDDLHARADKIITDYDFPAASGLNNIIADELDNLYYRTDAANRLVFIPHAGNHGGMIYYFAGDVDVELGNPNPLGSGYDPEEEITNLTFAADRSIRWSVGGNDAWGGENEDQVAIVAGEDIDFGGTTRSDGTFEPRGVVLLAGGDIRWRNGGFSTTYNVRNLRMIAEGGIEIEGPYGLPLGVAYNLNFGPPCPPNVVRLGRLVTP
jgi:hypothetical protein